MNLFKVNGGKKNRDFKRTLNLEDKEKGDRIIEKK